jgi:hypothetical protein
LGLFHELALKGRSRAEVAGEQGMPVAAVFMAKSRLRKTL